MMLKESIFPFFEYLRKPVIPHKLKHLKSIQVFLYLFLFSLLVDITIDWFTSSGYITNRFQIANAQALEVDIYRKGLMYAIIAVGIAAPILEELMNRSYLTSFTCNQVVLPLSCCFILIQLFNITSTIGLFIIIGFAFIFCILIYSKITQSPKHKNKFLRFYAKNYWLFFYTSAIAFGVLHIDNYHIQRFVPILPIVLVLPQIFAGLVLGYVRIVMGLRWSMALHGLKFCLQLIPFICLRWSMALHGLHNLFFVAFLFISHL